MEIAPLGFNLSRNLLDLDDDELSRFQRCEADVVVDDSQIDIVLSCRAAIAANKVRVARRSTLESTFAKESLHERTDVQSNLGPQRFIVRFEHNPMRSAIQALLEEQGEPPNGDVLPFGCQLV